MFYLALPVLLLSTINILSKQIPNELTVIDVSSRAVEPKTNEGKVEFTMHRCIKGFGIEIKQNHSKFYRAYIYLVLNFSRIGMPVTVTFWFHQNIHVIRIIRTKQGRTYLFMERIN